MVMYIVIFCAKLVEVTLSTVRLVLINRGEKLKGSVIAFFEIAIWLYLVSSILDNIATDPIKAVTYCVAFGLGNYVGSIVENKLAVGNAYIQVVVKEEVSDNLCAVLRELGFGVTTLKGRGIENEVHIISIYLKRKRVNEAVGVVSRYSPGSMVTVNDVRQVRNGFGLMK